MSLLVRNTEHKCKLSCFNRIKQSYYTTPENVLDGTPCSYDHPSDLCVQADLRIVKKFTRPDFWAKIFNSI